MIRIPFYLNEIEGWKEFYIDRRKSAEIILKSFLILISQLSAVNHRIMILILTLLHLVPGYESYS